MGTLEELKILLAEDNTINQRIAAIIFKQMELNFDMASNGDEAYEMYQQNKYNLILMDIKMPITGGLEATRLIRSFEKETGQTHSAFIVALTASFFSEEREACLEAGMNDIMEKPFQKDMLRSLIAKF